jgi:hypothetical protein
MRPAAWYYASTNTVSQSCHIPSSIVSESASVPCSQSKRAVVMSLRRWKSFFPAFAAIDTAIETATGARSRDKFRQLRSELVEMLCDAADDDADRVKGLCRLLDAAMAEALLTLHVVPVHLDQVGARRRVGHHGVGRSSVHSPDASAGAEA